jgi:Zn-dependent peptidase ImmA (M78 family)/DNA-binding XRE family transcriptional regulator
MDLTTLSTNLRRLRAGQKLSQVEMADQAGLSREGYRRIEEGLVEPRTNSLLRIAAVLGVRAEELLVPVRQLNAVRFRAQKRMTSREDLLASVARWLDNYGELEELLGDRVEFGLEGLCQRLRAARGRADYPKFAAAEARKALKLKDGELIRDICGLLEDNGVKVFTPSIASEGFFGLSVGGGDGGPAVVVNCWDRISVERWIFTAAHELGHLLLHLDAYDVTQSEENETQEAEANLFASYFLVPDKAFDQEWEEARGLGLVERVFKVKRIFRVSWKTVVYRIASRSPDGAKVWAQFYGAYKRSRGKPLKGIEEPEGLRPEAFLSPTPENTPVARVADEPEHLLPSDFVEDRLLRLVRKGIENGEISLGRAAEILDKDVKSMRALAASWME